MSSESFNQNLIKITRIFYDYFDEYPELYIVPDETCQEALVDMAENLGSRTMSAEKLHKYVMFKTAAFAEEHGIETDICKDIFDQFEFYEDDDIRTLSNYIWENFSLSITANELIHTILYYVSRQGEEDHKLDLLSMFLEPVGITKYEILWALLRNKQQKGDSL